jgi:hypothetical protein
VLMFSVLGRGVAVWAACDARVAIASALHDEESGDARLMYGKGTIRKASHWIPHGIKAMPQLLRYLDTGWVCPSSTLCALKRCGMLTSTQPVVRGF